MLFSVNSLLRDSSSAVIIASVISKSFSVIYGILLLDEISEINKKTHTLKAV